MNQCMKKWVRRTSIMGGIVLLAGIMSFITTKKAVWITLKRQKENQQYS